MIYKSDSDAVEPIDLTDCRQWLSISATDQSIDSTLTQIIREVRTRAESVLPFWLAERGLSLTVPFSPTIHIKGEIQRLIQVSVTTSLGVVTVVTDECGIISTPNGSVITMPKDTDPMTSVSVVFLPTAYIDDSIRLALLMGVRTCYQDRLADPLTDQVMTVLAPYIGENC